MLFSSWVVLTALISLSTFATGTSDRADALPDGAHLLEPYLTSALQSSSTQHDGGSSPKVIRGLLFKRQSCPIGFGLCTSGNGLCCPLGGRCCNSGGCCNAGEFCCGVTNCCPTGSSCCSNGGCCRLGTVCDGGGCCPIGKICTGPPPPPITIGDPGGPTFTDTFTDTFTNTFTSSIMTFTSPKTTIVPPTTSVTSLVAPTFTTPSLTTSLAIPNTISLATTLLPGYIYLIAFFVSFPLIMTLIYI